MILPDQNPAQTSLNEPAVATDHQTDGNSRSSESSRISLPTCRTLLGNGCNLTDVEVLRLRDAMYDLAQVALSLPAALSRKTNTVHDGFEP